MNNKMTGSALPPANRKNMSKIFCQCDKCKRDLWVGETMVTLTKNKEKIESESCVQPLSVKILGTWCESCASKLTKQ
ncbi:hypothetical protein DFP78_113127 [Photobacterium lutimaris]|nr:hypothetical protein DFP78_113127 [Photobacterium lutimaris]